MDELFSFPEFADFPLSLHLAMLEDDVRMKKYSSAISNSIKPGDVVVDIGSGTGILSFLAANCGAAEVHGIEQSQLATYAKRIKDQSFSKANIEFHQLDILNDKLPDINADVLVCELFGNFGIEEELIEIIKKAKDAFLKPEGRMIPEQLSLFVAPVQCSTAYRELANWNMELYGIDFSPLQQLAYNSIYHIQSEPVRVLAPPSKIAQLDLYQLNTTIFKEASFIASTASTLHGVAGWFETQLAPGIVLNTGPDAPQTHWGQILFPIGDPVELAVDDRLTFQFEETRDANNVKWRWSGTISRNNKNTEISKFEYFAHRSL